MEYVNAGEYGLALEMLSDWYIDAEPEIVVSANEIIEFFNVCQGMKIKRPWVELLPLLNPQEIGNIPQNYIVLARDYIENEVVDNPVRREWLNKVASVINEIEEFA
jgi:hypothetical protein